MAEKLTPLYPPHIKPARKGAYELKSIGADHFFLAMWNGRQWVHPALKGPLLIQQRRWRGLAQQPKGAA